MPNRFQDVSAPKTHAETVLKKKRCSDLVQRGVSQPTLLKHTRNSKLKRRKFWLHRAAPRARPRALSRGMRFDRLQQMGCALFASLALNVALLTLLGTATRPERTSEGCATKSPISNGSNAWQRLTSEGCATKSDTSNGENAWQRRCLDREPLLAGCDSYLLCAQTPPARAMVQSSFTDALYHRTIPRALMDSTEGPATRTLLVPIRKAILPGEPGTSELDGVRRPGQPVPKRSLWIGKLSLVAWSSGAVAPSSRAG